MSSLLARDALAAPLVAVGAEDRPAREDVAEGREIIYAVFENGDRAWDSRHLLGVLDRRRVAIFPHRIFADLLPSHTVRPVRDDLPLEEVQQRLTEDVVGTLAVIDQEGTVVGAVTRDSLLTTLIDQERQAARTLRESLDLHERQRSLIAYEIHDGLLQYAVAASMRLQACVQARIQQSMDEETESNFIRAMTLIREVVREGRALIQGIQPGNQGNLEESLRTLVATMSSPAGPEVEFVWEGGEFGLSETHRWVLFRIIQEALANALKHSESERVRVEVARRQDRVELLVRDWGRGFDPCEAPSGHGLVGMRNRTELLSGELQLISSPGEGTTIRVTFPLS